MACNDPSQRLARLSRLRAMKAPEWVIKSEQVALALARKGMAFKGIGKRASKLQGELMARHVSPLMAK